MPKKSWGFLRSKLVLTIIAVLVVGIGGYFLLSPKNPTYQFVTVQRGPITESVSLTGNTTPSQSVSLTFSAGGIISRAYSDLGKKVNAGQVLAELNTNDLAAGVRSALANVDVQKAKLQGLQAGSRPEDIAASQAALDKATQDMANLYTSIVDASLDSYAKGQDAVQTQINGFFSLANSGSPTLTYASPDSQVQIDAQWQRLLAGEALNKWQAEISSSDQSTSALDTLLKNNLSYLATIRQLLNTLSKTLSQAINLSESTLATYKAAVSAALTKVNTAASSLNTITQNIASQKLTVAQLQAQLDLKHAGSLPTDIAAQRAQVEQAQANLDSARAQLQNAQIIAPITGTITQYDAKVGQQASVGTSLISIMSDAGYEVDAGVSETDIGKVSLDDKVTMTLDAFPRETFDGSVFYIAPAETNTQGVVSYEIKISFDKKDARLKSGLTANINIETTHKDDVLVLPQYAILQNDDGTFVQVVEEEKTRDIPVTLGIQDQNGNVEVVSGVTEGQQVLNIGLKSQ